LVGLAKDWKGRSIVKYLLTMIGDEAASAAMSPEESAEFGDQIEAFNEALRKGGAWVAAEGLGPKAESKTISFSGGAVSVRDGTFSDAADQSLGYWVIEASSLDDAVEWGRKLGIGSGIVEVRTVFE
jgi:hypothetical protein